MKFSYLECVTLLPLVSILKPIFTACPEERYIANNTRAKIK